VHRRLRVLLAVTSALLVTACGDPGRPTVVADAEDAIGLPTLVADAEDAIGLPTLVADAEDAIAFELFEEDGVAVMTPDGTLLDLMPGVVQANPWPRRDEIISQVCGSSFDVLPILLVSPDGLVFGPPKPDWLPAISPNNVFAAIACFLDGDTVVVVDDHEGLATGVRDDWSRSGRAAGSDQVELRIVNVDGSQIHEVSRNVGADWLPRWSPDSQHILFESNSDPNSEIYVIKAGGWPPQNVSLMQPVNNLYPAWSRDGNFVAFARDEWGKSVMYVRPVLGTENGVKQMGALAETHKLGYPIPWGE